MTPSPAAWAAYGDALIRFLFLNWALQATLILAAGLLLARLPRLRASVSHGILAASLALALCAPLLRAVPARRLAPVPNAGAVRGSVRVARIHQAASTPRPAAPEAPLGWALAGAWLVVALLRLGWLAGGIWSVRRLLRRARPVDFGPLTGLEVLEAPGITVPSVVGIRRPRILVPAGLAEQLDAATLRAVLLHEEAHALRRDPFFLFLGAFCHALLFWNPLAGMARRRMEAAAEDACDAYVLSRGVAAPGYARGLITVLESAAGSRRPAIACLLGLAPASAVGAELRRRVLRILAGTPRTSPVAAGAASLALAGTVGACALTELGARPTAPRRPRPSAALPIARAIPRAPRARVLVRPKARTPVRLDAPSLPEPAPVPDRTALRLPESEPIPAAAPVLAAERVRTPPAGRYVVYVLDVSSSMRPHLPAARNQILEWIRDLSPDDTFNVVAFASDVTWYSGGPVTPKPVTVAGVQSWMESLPEKTGTNLALGLQAALETPNVSRVVILSDGEAWAGDAARVQLAGQIERENPSGAAVEEWQVGRLTEPLPEWAEKAAPIRNPVEADETPPLLP